MMFNFDLEKYTKFFAECSDEDLANEFEALQEILSCDNITKISLLDILNDIEYVLQQEICNRFKTGIKKPEDKKINVMGFVIRCKADDNESFNIVS